MASIKYQVGKAEKLFRKGAMALYVPLTLALGAFAPSFSADADTKSITDSTTLEQKVNNKDERQAKREKRTKARKNRISRAERRDIAEKDSLFQVYLEKKADSLRAYRTLDSLVNLRPKPVEKVITPVIDSNQIKKDKRAKEVLGIFDTVSKVKSNFAGDVNTLTMYAYNLDAFDTQTLNPRKYNNKINRISKDKFYRSDLMTILVEEIPLHRADVVRDFEDGDYRSASLPSRFKENMTLTYKALHDANLLTNDEFTRQYAIFTYGLLKSNQKKSYNERITEVKALLKDFKEFDAEYKRAIVNNPLIIDTDSVINYSKSKIDTVAAPHLSKEAAKFISSVWKNQMQCDSVDKPLNVLVNEKLHEIKEAQIAYNIKHFQDYDHDHEYGDASKIPRASSGGGSGFPGSYLQDIVGVGGENFPLLIPSKKELDLIAKEMLKHGIENGYDLSVVRSAFLFAYPETKFNPYIGITRIGASGLYQIMSDAIKDINATKKIDKKLTLQNLSSSSLLSGRAAVEYTRLCESYIKLKSINGSIKDDLGVVDKGEIAPLAIAYNFGAGNFDKSKFKRELRASYFDKSDTEVRDILSEKANLLNHETKNYVKLVTKLDYVAKNADFNDYPDDFKLGQILGEQGMYFEFSGNKTPFLEDTVKVITKEDKKIVLRDKLGIEYTYIGDRFNVSSNIKEGDKIDGKTVIGDGEDVLISVLFPNISLGRDPDRSGTISMVPIHTFSKLTKAASTTSNTNYSINEDFKPNYDLVDTEFFKYTNVVKINDGFGPRIHPVTGKKGKMHEGIDLNYGGAGKKIYYPADGVIVHPGKAGEPGRYKYNGNVVRTAYGENYDLETLFLHLHKKSKFPVGTKVTKQDYELEGKEGRVTGSHLHSELRENVNWHYSTRKSNPIMRKVDAYKWSTTNLGKIRTRNKYLK